MPFKDALPTDTIKAILSAAPVKIFMILTAMISIYVVYAIAPYLGPLSEATARRMLGETAGDAVAIRDTLEKIKSDHDALFRFRDTIEILADNVKILTEKVDALDAINNYNEENFIRSVDIAMQAEEILTTYRERMGCKRLEIFRLHDGRPDIVWSKNTGLDALFYSCYVDAVRPGARSFRPEMQRIPSEAFTVVNSRLVKKYMVVLACDDVTRGSLLQQWFTDHGVNTSLFYPIHAVDGENRYLGFLKADYDDMPESKQTDAGLYFEKKLMKNAATAVAASLVVVLRKDFR